MTKVDTWAEVWTGDAVDQLLRGLGIDPATVKYRVTDQQWDRGYDRREVRAVEDVIRDE